MRWRNLIGGAVAGLTILAASGPAHAHHSAAMFDRDKVVTLNATVKAWKWTNPHAWIQVVAPGANGATSEWNFECSTINILARKGWTIKSFKPGDKIEVTAHPMKDGTTAGLIMTVKTPDGRTLVDHDY